MNNLTFSDSMVFPENGSITSNAEIRNLSQAVVNQDYVIKGIDNDDADMAQFLFTLGCFDGETITLISILSESYVISVKDARYSIGSDLAQSIFI